MDKNTEQIKAIFLKNLDKIERPGIEILKIWMEENGFFTAPASRGHHLAHEGGLMIHSLNVMNEMAVLNASHGMHWPEQKMLIVALLHDICKTDEYKRSINGYEYEWNHLGMPLGHGEKSLYIIQKFMQLEPDEALAIRWHMGVWTKGVKEDPRDYNRARAMTSLVDGLHIADMIASQIVEEKK